MRERSKESLDFEQLWRSMRHGALVPARKDFKPAQVARLLPDIALIEAPGADRNALKIRLAGQSHQVVFPYKLAGTDHLDILPEKYHDGALASARLMVEKPCGLWQIMPLYFPRSGFGRLLELTAFPLTAGADGIPLILAYARSVEEVFEASQASEKIVEFDTALEFRFIDVGAGEPLWPAEAA